jgi:Tfp pilus assembly protein PilX
MIKLNQRRGVAILFAVLLVSTVLAISLTLLNITYRQLLLSSTVRESQLAFYAADSALNCARHWDSFRRLSNNPNPFGFFYNDDTGLHFSNPSANTLTCGDGAVVNFDSGTRVSTFRVSYTVVGHGPVCAKGQVTKYANSGDPNYGKTLITVQGYNVAADSNACPAAAAVTDRTLERALSYGPY